VHHGAMMRRYWLWMAWIVGSLTVALIVLTILAAVTDCTPWLPLLAATLAAAVAGTMLIVRGPQVARQQERERRAQPDQRVR
jgi:Na+-driven multidrug efflux pump